jgi:hypothetical protein
MSYISECLRPLDSGPGARRYSDTLSWAVGNLEAAMANIGMPATRMVADAL